MEGWWGRLVTWPNALSVGMVAAAGVVTWYGVTATELLPRDAEPTAEETITLAAEPPPPVVVEPPIGRVAEGRLPTRVVIPSAGIDSAVTEVGVVLEDGRPVWETAWRSAGHHLNSALPGQPGNVVLTGHVSVADSRNIPVFANLDGVAEGDVVEVHAGEHVHRYEVVSVQVVEADETRVLRSDHRSLLTLITCTPDLKHRLVVTGQLI
ncbi:MAG: sortase [Dehalococcoidia bacterium]|nr:sortase [Dehalococcoidia bacterium]